MAVTDEQRELAQAIGVKGATEASLRERFGDKLDELLPPLIGSGDVEAQSIELNETAASPEQARMPKERLMLYALTPLGMRLLER